MNTVLYRILLKYFSAIENLLDKKDRYESVRLQAVIFNRSLDDDIKYS